ncbi:acyl-CoA thioesterase II [gamma proteobacterium HTCC5015]|nr:acyl-CoA thioesterase II [gamma proteobacterium HTCC5015]
MSRVLDELLELLKLEAIEENIFRGQSQDLGFGNLFGGQVLGQSLSAASQTVDTERPVHSLHAYFLRPGDPKRGIVYQVDNLRDGGSFSTRRITAIQRGKPILSMEASFQRIEQGFEHSDAMPEGIPRPDDLPSDSDLAHKVADKIPQHIRNNVLSEKPIEIRPVLPLNPFAPEKMAPVQHVWFKASGTLPNDPMVHRYMLAYASDFKLCTTAMRPHGVSFIQPNMQVASLDHAMWFHRPFRFDDWLLYTMESPTAVGGRGLNRGRIYTRDGVLVASTTQEALIRQREK